MEHWFFHLETTPLKGALPELLEKTREKGWTALVCFRDASVCKDMDDYLWTYKDDSFLPHGPDDKPLAEHHPIRLTHTAKSAGGTDAVFLTDGVELDNYDGVKRCVTLIDGRSESAVTRARGQWRKAKEGNAVLSYWQQNEHGKWEKKAS